MGGQSRRVVLIGLVSEQTGASMVMVFGGSGGLLGLRVLMLIGVPVQGTGLGSAVVVDIGVDAICIGTGR